MKKKLAFLMVALVAVGAFALQTSFRALNNATAAEDWEITAGAYSLLGNAEQSLVGQTASVTIDGNDVTLSVTASNIPVTLNGTLSGTTVTFPKGQAVMGQYYLLGSNADQTSVTDIVFTYDATAKTLTQQTPRIVVSMAEDAVTNPMAYMKDVVLQGPNASTSHYYKKVTTASDLSNGEYLIVYEGDNTHAAVAFDGSLSTLDVAENGVAVTISDGAIASSTALDAATFTIASTADGYTVKSASGLFVGQTSHANGLKTSETAAAGYYHGISFDGSGNAVLSIDTSTDAVTQSVTMRYNYAENQLRFRYYKNGQQPIALYKKVAGEMPVAEFDYYVVGKFSGTESWGPAPERKMTRNTAADTEEYMLTMNLAANDELKVVKSSDGTTVDTWYPDPGDNYAITADGEYTIYFRPNGDGNNDWYCNVIYVAATPISTIAEAQAADAGTTVTVEGTVVASAANGAVLYDGTDYIYYYNTSNALQLKHKVRMKGAVSVYGGAKQFNSDAVITDLGEVDYSDPDPVVLDGAALNATVTAGTVTRQFVALQGHLTISGNYYNVTVEGAEGVQASLVKPKEDLSSLNDKDVVICGYAMYMTGSNTKYVYIVATIVGEPDVLEPVVWPEGVEGETWSITTTAAQTGGATQNIENEPCRVAYLADAAEAYLQAPFTLQGRQFVVTLKGSVDANKNVTIPMGQLVAQDEQTGMNAFIFAKNADQEFDDVVLTYSETAEKLSLKYEGNIYLYLTGDPGANDNPVFTLTNTEVFKEIEASEEDGYYVVGNMTEWTPNADYKMTKNEAAETEEYMFTMDLTTTSQFKVVKVEDGEQTWYPDGMGNNYGENGEITADGEYTIYFRPNADGGDDWFYNVIYVAASAEPLPELPGDVIWSSNTPVVLPASWDGSAAPHVAADKFADANVGDVLHIAVEGVAESSNVWSAQVAPYADNVWAQLENGFPVGTGNIPEAYFPITGDMLKLLKANGLIIFGAGYSTRLATLERGVYEGSEYSIWVGDKTLTWTQATVERFHFANAGVEAGMTLKLIYEATGSPNIQLVYGWNEGENYGQVTYGEGFATLEVTEDMIENLTSKGLIVNAAGIRLTQIELLPAAPAAPENLYFLGDSQGWNLAEMPAFTKDADTGNFTYEVTVENEEPGFFFAISDVPSVETPGAEGTEDDWAAVWADFNETHRWAVRAFEDVEIVEGQPMQLSQLEGTLVIKSLGVFTITITPEMMISITKTGEVTPQDPDYYVVGESTPLGLAWGVVEANKMELQQPDRSSDDKIYVKTYENVEFTAGDVIKFKVGASTNGTDISTWYPEGMGNEYTAEISMDGTYKVTFTFNATQSTTENPVIDINIESVSNPELNGDWIFWTEDDVCAQGSAETLYGTDDFYVSLVDTDGKHAVDANNAYFGDATQQIKFTHRFKTSGKSGAKNSMTLTIPSDGKLSVYVRTGSNSATDRNLVLTQGENELYNQVVQEADAIEVAPEDLNVVNPAKAEGDPVKVYPIITVDVVAGEVAVGYPTGSLNFYAFQFVSETTGIVNIMPEQQGFDESLPAYNLQGQRVTKSYRGIVIQNGRKFMNK